MSIKIYVKYVKNNRDFHTTKLNLPTGNLDSKTGKLVIEELENINQNMGKTIIMVTHDPQMASYCTRVIVLKDGMILKDLRKNEIRENFYTRIVDEMQNL